MAKTAKAKKTATAKKTTTPREKILGIARKGTCTGNVLSELMDGKLHSIESLQECRVIDRDSIGWRITLLQEKGKHAERPFKIEKKDDDVKLIFLGRNGASSKSTKGSAHAKTTKTTATKEAATASRASVQDVPTADED
jgi:hypothetical protein